MGPRKGRIPDTEGLQEMTPEAIRDVCSSFVKLRDGSMTTRDMIDAERYLWRDAWPPINAKPDRWKICPICNHSQPIAESDVLRTIVKMDRFENEVAVPVADVAAYCASCRKETE